MPMLGDLAEFLTKTSYNNLPTNVIEAAKNRILDTLGVALWGRHEGRANRLVSLIDEFGGPSESTIWGEKKRVPAIWASFANGYSATFMSDTTRLAGAHPGAVVVPAALATAERQNSSGRDFILAVVVGYDVFIRIGCAAYPFNSKRGFQVTSVIGPLGAAAAASKILGLDREVVTNALSISAVMGAGLLEAFKYFDTVAITTGRASHAGIMAALLAQKGYEGTHTMLEGGSFCKEGFLDAFAGQYFPELITKELGKDYLILNTAPKIHWGCRHMACPTDVVMEIVAKHSLKPENIREINIKEYSEAFRLERNIVEGKDDALWSSRFSIAVAVLTGEPVYPTRFTDEMARNREVQKLMAKVNIEVNPELDKEFPQKWPSIAEVITTNGERFHHRLDYPLGEPENPISSHEADRKFRMLAQTDIGTENVEKIFEVVKSLENRMALELTSLLG